MHCSKRTQDLQILVGTNKLGDGGSYYRAKQIFPHDKFNQPRFDEPESGQLQYANDIALIQMESSIKLSDKVYPIAVSDKIVKVTAENVEKLQITAWPIVNVCVSYFFVFSCCCRCVFQPFFMKHFNLQEKGERSDSLKVLNVTLISAEECKHHSAVGTPVNSTLCTVTPANKLIYVSTTSKYKKNCLKCK